MVSLIICIKGVTFCEGICLLTAEDLSTVSNSVNNSGYLAGTCVMTWALVGVINVLMASVIFCPSDVARWSMVFDSGLSIVSGFEDSFICNALKSSTRTSSADGFPTPVWTMAFDGFWPTWPNFDALTVPTGDIPKWPGCSGYSV